MKLCLVGHHTGARDEGTKNISSQLARELAKRHCVDLVDARRPWQWIRVWRSKPDVLHFVLGGSSRLSLAVVAFVGPMSPRSKTVVSLVQPLWLRSSSGRRMRLPAVPDLFLVPSSDLLRVCLARGWRTALLPNGVDLARFTPIAAGEKARLREKYGFPGKAFLAFHVGAIMIGRGVERLVSLQTSGCQVVLAGRPSQRGNPRLVADLRRHGCIVHEEFIPAIQEMYALSDCYVFPVVDQHNSIEMPLSVLEAMACNLPVVTTPFGALPDHFSGVRGVSFFQDETTMLRLVESLREDRPSVDTRKAVLDYSWERIAQKAERLYADLLA